MKYVAQLFLLLTLTSNSSFAQASDSCNLSNNSGDNYLYKICVNHRGDSHKNQVFYTSSWMLVNIEKVVPVFANYDLPGANIFLRDSNVGINMGHGCAVENKKCTKFSIFNASYSPRYNYRIIIKSLAEDGKLIFDSGFLREMP